VKFAKSVAETKARVQLAKTKLTNPKYTMEVDASATTATATATTATATASTTRSGSGSTLREEIRALDTALLKV